MLQIPSFPAQQVEQDLVLGCASPEASLTTGKRRRKLLVTHAEAEEDGDGDKKKILHRDIERQRRQEMASLHASLRSLLPLEYIRGKRSKSDHMQQAVNYITHLQKKIKELGAKRDELKKITNFSGLGEGRGPSLDDCFIDSTVTVSLCRDGIDILISNGFREQEFPLSRVLGALAKEGLEVVSCLSTAVNDRLVHMIKSEASDQTSVDPSKLQEKLTHLIKRN
ncbi:hypothetical protein NMG60_11018176 [Bertholletia excelsa]